MIVTSEGLADTIVSLLVAQAQTTSGLAAVPSGSIFGVRAYPTQTSQLPQVQLTLPEEEKASISRNAGNQFVVTATIPLVIRVQQPAGPKEAGAAAARGQLADIVRAIETTVIGAPSLQQQIQRVLFVRSHGRVDGTGAEIVGERVLMFGLEFYQGPEDFYVQVPVPLAEVDVFDRNPDGTQGAERLQIIVGDEPSTGSGELDFTDPDNSGLAALT